MHKPLFVIAWLGLIVAGYLFATSVSALPLLCGSGGCHEVQSSIYAKHFGLPTAFYGVVFYCLLGLLAIVWRPQPPRWIVWSLILLTGTGFGVTLWLTYLEAFVIQAWCAWCVISALLSTIAFLIVWRHANN